MQRWIILIILAIVAYLLFYWLIKKVQENSSKWGKPEGKPEKQKETDMEKMKRNY